MLKKITKNIKSKILNKNYDDYSQDTEHTWAGCCFWTSRGARKGAWVTIRVDMAEPLRLCSALASHWLRAASGAAGGAPSTARACALHLRGFAADLVSRTEIAAVCTARRPEPALLLSERAATMLFAFARRARSGSRRTCKIIAQAQQRAPWPTPYSPPMPWLIVRRFDGCVVYIRNQHDARVHGGAHFWRHFCWYCVFKCVTLSINRICSLFCMAGR